MERAAGKPEPAKKKATEWTPAMRAAAAKRLRMRWKQGAFNHKKKPQKTAAAR